MKNCLLLSLALIFANSHWSQAAWLENPSSQQIPTENWRAAYAGATELDGLTVIAAFEKSEQELSVPRLMADRAGLLVPFAAPTKAAYRLTLVPQTQTNIRVSFPLNARTVMLDGQPALAYFSRPRAHDQFHFTLFPQADGTLKVTYQRQGEPREGAFLLQPVPQLF